MIRPTISPGSAIPPGAGVAFGDAVDAEVVPVPPVSTPTNKPAFREEWLSTPSVLGQRQVYPDTVRLDKTKAEVFDLSDSRQLELYSELLQRTDPIKGDVQIFVDEGHFSEKTDNWKRFLRYNTYLFKQLAPKKES